MAKINTAVTPLDLKDDTLHLQIIRHLVASVNQIHERLSMVEGQPKALSIEQIRDNLSSGGTAPLDVSTLSGQLVRPQTAKVPTYTTVPTGQTLQALSGGQLIVAGGGLYLVVAGNPNTLIAV